MTTGIISRSMRWHTRRSYKRNFTKLVCQMKQTISLVFKDFVSKKYIRDFRLWRDSLSCAHMLHTLTHIHRQRWRSSKTHNHNATIRQTWEREREKVFYLLLSFLLSSNTPWVAVNSTTLSRNTLVDVSPSREKIRRHAIHASCWR